MKPTAVLIDMACYPEGPNRTSTLTAEQHDPELLPDGWLRFKINGPTDKDGKPMFVNWYRVPPWGVKRITEPRQIETSAEVSSPAVKRAKPRA